MNLRPNKEVRKLKDKMEDKRPKVKKGTIKRLLKMITSRYKKRLILVLICLVISSVVSVSAPLFSKRIIDDYIVALFLKYTEGSSVQDELPVNQNFITLGTQLEKVVKDIKTISNIIVIALNYLGSKLIIFRKRKD